MKIKKFTLGFVAAGVFVFSAYTLLSNQNQAYFPTKLSITSASNLYKGAAEYYKMLRADVNTGEIPVNEVLRVRKEIAQNDLISKAPIIQWTEMGPDNVGGRTRAVIVDNQNPNRYWAGSVSGGLWVSENRGLTWSAYNDNLDNLAISDLAQASDGTIYFGTGPLFDGTRNNKVLGSEVIGDGLFKVTGNGTVQRLVGPIGNNDRNYDWSGINHIAVDPSNPLKIYAAQNTGLKASHDGGVTWFNPIPSSTPFGQDVDVTPTGKVIATFFGGKVYLSDDGTANSFTLSTIPETPSRTEIAVAPSDENIVYASATSSSLVGIFRSSDGGATWNNIGPGGSQSFDPFCSSSQCQGFYDNAIGVSTTDPGLVLVGGVTLWRWNQSPNPGTPNTGSWSQIAYNFDFPGSTIYVHSDIHRILFTKGNEALIGSDGGINRSSNLDQQAPSFVSLNSGFNVTQFYDIGVGANGNVAGGTQDNGTKVLGYNFNTGKSAINIRGGDGFDTEYSALVPSVAFASLYFGNVAKVTGLANNIVDVNQDEGTFYNSILTTLCLENQCGPFYTSFKLWETFNDVNSRDTVDRVFTATDRKYLSGETVSVPSQTSGRDINYVLTRDIPMGSLDTLKVIDRYQSITALANAQQSQSVTSLHISRDALKNLASTEIKWFKIAGPNSTPEELTGDIIVMEFTRDGDIIYLGNRSGDVFRISGLNAAWQFNDYSYTTTSSYIKCKRIGRFSGRAVTGIAVDPNNNDNVIVTCGNYNNSAYVFRTTFATTASDPSGTFESIQGTGLPPMPTYDVVIDKDNPDNIIIGTEFGVYATENGFSAAANSVSWKEENMGMAKVPVYAVEQQQFSYEYASNSGMVYIGTHGRGIFKSDKYVGIRDIKSNNKTFESRIKMYPNPVRENATIEFSLTASDNINLIVYDINGNQVKVQNLGSINAGKQIRKVKFNSLSKGTYILMLQGSNGTETTKFIVTE